MEPALSNKAATDIKLLEMKNKITQIKIFYLTDGCERRTKGYE